MTLLMAACEHKWFQLLFPAWVLVGVVILFIRPVVVTAFMVDSGLPTCISEKWPGNLTRLG